MQRIISITLAPVYYHKFILLFTLTAGTIEDYKPTINTFQNDKREERKVVSYTFIVSCNMNSKIPVCMIGVIRY